MQNITLKNADQLKQKLNDIANINVVGAINQATALVHGQAKALAPANDGLLRNSIHMSVKNGVGRVYTNVEYASYVEFGTGIKGNGTYPYKIKGLNLKYESSPWYIPVDKIKEKDAQKYHFKKVQGKDGKEYYECYGQKSQSFMYRALKENEKLIKEILKKGVRDHLAQNCKGD